MKKGIGLIFLFASFTCSIFSQENLGSSAINLNYRSCEGDLAVFILENKSRKPIFARVNPVPYWEKWKRANAQYGTFTLVFKVSESNEIIKISDKFDAPRSFTTIRPGMKIRYGIPLRKGTGIYKVGVPFIDSTRMKKMLDNFANLTSEQINLISLKEVISKETFIPCN